MFYLFLILIKISRVLGKRLLEKGFKVLFEDKFYMIKDANGKYVFKIKMRGKAGSLDR